MRIKDAKYKLSQLKSDAQNWLPVWKELSDRIDNSRGRFDEGTPNDGKKINPKILNSVPKRSLNTLAAGMLSGLTSPAQKWFRTGLANTDLMEWDPVKSWLEKVDEIMMAVFGMSNIYNSFHSSYLELGQFGTACGIIDEDYDRVINTKVFTCGEYYIGLNSKGQVNELGRVMNMTALQIVEAFGLNSTKGEEKKDLREAYEKGSNKFFTVYHLIAPNKNRVPGKIDNKNMPYSSTYWLSTSGDDDMPLHVGGYNENPIFCPRWDVVSSDKYGRGPSWFALADIKQLYKMEKNKLLTLDKIGDPPIQASADATINTLPGGISRYNPTNPNSGVRPVYQVNSELNAQQAMIEQTKKDISDAFYVDLFQMLKNIDRAQITAREIAERHEEKLLQLGPVLINLEREQLNPIVERVFGILLRNGMLPPPPKELQGQDLNVEYISPLAMAQKMIEAQSIERTVGFIGNLATVKPEVMDLLDTDEAARIHSRLGGSPAKIIRSKEVVDQIRQGREKQMKAQALMESADKAVQIAKNASAVTTKDGSNLVDRVMPPQEQA